MPATTSTQITPEILEQNPLLAAYLMLVMGVVSMAAVGSFVTWGLVFYWRSQSQPLLPLIRPWEPRRWAFVDLIVIGISFVSFQVALAGLASRYIAMDKSSKLSLELAAMGGLGSIAAVVFGTVWICLRYRTNFAHVGFGALKLKILAIGMMGGLLSLPLLYVLMGLVSAVSSTKYDHPLINSASESGQFHTYLLGFFAAAIAAPISEEFLFRVILQGWLQSIPFKSVLANFIGTWDSSSAVSPSCPSENESCSDQPEFSDAAADEIRQVYASSAQLDSSQTLTSPLDSSGAVPPIWPSLITGLLFGLAHIEYGLSFIPLTFLGIVLGLIYRQTHSIWPCIIIHMMLNSFSMMMLGLVILMKQAGIAVE